MPVPAPSVDDVIVAIRAHAVSRKWTIADVARDAKLSFSGLRHMWQPGWNPKADMLRVLRSRVPDDFDPAPWPQKQPRRKPAPKRKMLIRRRPSQLFRKDFH